MALELTAYFDDSGHPDDQIAVVVAGWIATLQQWLLLESRWQEVLKRFSIKSGVFHRSTFQFGEGEYSHLSGQDKTRLLYKLINLIRTGARQGFCVIAPMQDYRRVNDEYYVEETFGKPFALAGAVVATSIASWKERYAERDEGLWEPHESAIVSDSLSGPTIRNLALCRTIW